LTNEYFSNLPLDIVDISEMQECGLKYVIHIPQEERQSHC